MLCIVHCLLTCALQQLIVVVSSTGQSRPVAIHKVICWPYHYDELPELCCWGNCATVATLEYAPVMPVPFVQPVQHL